MLLLFLFPHGNNIWYSIQVIITINNNILIIYNLQNIISKFVYVTCYTSYNSQHKNVYLLTYVHSIVLINFLSLLFSCTIYSVGTVQNGRLHSYKLQISQEELHSFSNSKVSMIFTVTCFQQFTCHQQNKLTNSNSALKKILNKIHQLNTVFSNVPQNTSKTCWNTHTHTVYMLYNIYHTELSGCTYNWIHLQSIDCAVGV